MTFKTPYKKPKKFTADFSDFSPKVAKDILKLNDSELTWWHFQVIFHFDCCAGTYEECCYYLPLAIEHFHNKPEDSYEIIANVLYFIDKNQQRLQADGIFDKCKKALLEALNILTQSFNIMHFDKEQCQAKGWKGDFVNIVQNSDTVNALVDACVDYESLNSVVTDFMQTVSKEWFNELYRHYQEDFIPQKNISFYSELFSDVSNVKQPLDDK